MFVQAPEPRSPARGRQNLKLSRTQIGLVAPRFLLKRPSGAEGLVQPDILIPDDPFRAATAIEALLASSLVAAP